MNCCKSESTVALHLQQYDINPVPSAINHPFSSIIIQNHPLRSINKIDYNIYIYIYVYKHMSIYIHYMHILTYMHYIHYIHSIHCIHYIDYIHYLHDLHYLHKMHNIHTIHNRPTYLQTYRQYIHYIYIYIMHHHPFWFINIYYV